MEIIIFYFFIIIDFLLLLLNDTVFSYVGIFTCYLQLAFQESPVFHGQTVSYSLPQHKITYLVEMFV